MTSVNCVLRGQDEKCCGTWSPADQAQQPQPHGSLHPSHMEGLQDIPQMSTDPPTFLYYPSIQQYSWLQHTLTVGGEGHQDNCLVYWKMCMI
jgi:hypothetical protein